MMQLTQPPQDAPAPECVRAVPETCRRHEIAFVVRDRTVGFVLEVVEVADVYEHGQRIFAAVVLAVPFQDRIVVASLRLREHCAYRWGHRPARNMPRDVRIP